MNFFNIYISFKNQIYLQYLRYLRYRIYHIKNIHDIVNILKNIAFFYRESNADCICNLLMDCLNKYPLSEIELQKFSIIQQDNDLGHGLENYASFVLWISSIQSIIENENNRKLLT